MPNRRAEMAWRGLNPTEVNRMVKQVEILLVEDNRGDVRLVKEVLKKDDKWDPKISVVRDGVEALDFLERKGKYANSPTPQLIILDLNLPKKDGRDVLIEIKGNPQLARIPVVIFTSSENP